MSKSRKPLKYPRSLAFSRQNGNCYYCGLPMWTNDPQYFSSKYKISEKQAKHFKCTGEHLVAHQHGGSSQQDNIVAACEFCNLQRHRRKSNPSPTQYKDFVQQRMDKGRWHNIRLAT
ncbi:MAG: restriction endonuclease [Gammaproteobacteria bacterium]|nr:restriction endonuclease [Gammaproteobacteria bacterium]